MFDEDETIFLALLHPEKGAGRYEIYNLEDAKVEPSRKMRQPEKHRRPDPVIPSPPMASSGSGMAIVRGRLYIVGGIIVTGWDDIDDRREELHGHGHCIDITTLSSDQDWEPLGDLNTIRRDPLLVVLNDKLYTFANFPPAPNFTFPSDKPWAEVFDSEQKKWASFEITPCGVALPPIVQWYALHPDDPNSVILYGLDLEMRNNWIHRGDKGYNIWKLYCCDLKTNECRYFDDDFLDKFYETFQDIYLFGLDPFPCPAKDDNYLYFCIENEMFCYHLKTKLWIPEKVGGVNFRDIIPSPCPPYADFTEFKIFGLGKGRFCVIWFDLRRISSSMYWKKFVISHESGTPQLSHFSATKKIPLASPIDAESMFCVAIPTSLCRPTSNASLLLTRKGKERVRSPRIVKRVKLAAT